MRGTILICLISFALISALPVTKHKTEEKPPEPNIENPSELKNIVEYERYLNEVIQALESDPEFKKKLDKAPEADIRDGKIAQELDYVNHNVRTKLDEIKRQEIDRLRHLASKQYELSNHIDREHLKIPQHLDHENEHTFEIEDLRKLILKTSEDLAEADRKRREEFKNYEMQKEFENQQKMKGMDEEHRKKYEHELVEKQKKHNQHEKVHHPGSKAQLEEVWEKQDEMDKGDFDPKIFFKMHDLDENGFWDEAEVKALFVKELDKVYEAGVPEDDMRERAEEMENMREHVFRETDTNRDNLISYDEFINQTKSKEFNSDPGWDTIDNSTPYSQTEYKQFEMEREREIKQLIEQGKLPPQPIPHDGYYNYDAAHPGYQQNVQFMPNQHPPMSNEISRDAIQHQQQQQQQQEQQYLHQQQYMQQQLHGQGHYPQQQPMMPQQQVPPGYQQQIPQHLPQQIPVNHDPHQQMHVPQLHQTQGNVQPQQQQVPQVPQQQQQVPQFPQQQQQQQVPQFPQQQQQQYVPPQQLPQQQQPQQAAKTNPQLVVPQNVPQLPQPNIQQPVNLVPAAAQPLASEQNNIPQIKTNHV